MSERPFIDWDWIADHTDDIVAQLTEHLLLTVLAVVIGFAISLPLAIAAYRRKRLYGPITGITGILYTIPSLALFVMLIPITGLSVLSAEIGLVSYTLLILIRNIVAGLNSVSADVKESATAMGLTRRGLLWRVELPLAVPAIIAGLRIATVTTIGLVTVTAFIGLGGLGRFILQGLKTFFPTATIVGASLSVALALVAEGLFIAMQPRIVPWSRKTSKAKAS